eukprot:718301-Prymnesium_polylepis.1
MPEDCFLEWAPWGEDRVMGLNHQMSALSCALGEAHFLNRTLLFPDRICLDVRHERRLQREEKPLDARCSFALRSKPQWKVPVFSVPTEELLDVAALSRLVPLRVVELPRSPSSRLHGFTPPPEERTFEITRAHKSSRVAAELPCGGRAALVRRRVSSFWFRPCAYRIADSVALIAHLARALRVPPERLPSPAPQLLPHMIRSGLFYSPSIKRAAAAVRRRIGAPYAAIHVRRSDKFSTSCELSQFSKADCRRMERITRPHALAAALSKWYANGSHVYVSSTEPPTFFEPLRAAYRLHLPEDFAAELAPITNNYALYAVETLVLFGASSVVQTFGYAAS